MAISITKRREFIHHIFNFFRAEQNESMVSTYDLALTTKYPVDWEAFYEDIIKTAETKFLPMPKFFTDKISKFRKVTSSTDDDCIIRVILKTGQEYTFTINNGCDCRTLEELKKRYKQKKNISQIIQYPPKTVIIGSRVLSGDELTAPKVLYST